MAEAREPFLAEAPSGPPLAALAGVAEVEGQASRRGLSVAVPRSMFGPPRSPDGIVAEMLRIDGLPEPERSRRARAFVTDYVVDVGEVVAAYHLGRLTDRCVGRARRERLRELFRVRRPATPNLGAPGRG